MEESLSMICVAIVLFLICFLLSKLLQKSYIKSSKEALKNKMNNINIEDYYIQEKKSIDLEINKIQSQYVFTEDYIKGKNKDNTLLILKSKELVRVYHYLYIKSTISNDVTYKCIVMEFIDGYLFIDDPANQKHYEKYCYTKSEFDFDNTIINLLKNQYPHIKVGFYTDNNDIRIFRTHKDMKFIIDGLKR